MYLEYKDNNSIRCPHCQMSYYKEIYTVSTAMGFSRVYHNGKMIEASDPNIYTHYCTCLNCGENFTFSVKNGRLYKEE